MFITTALLATSIFSISDVNSELLVNMNTSTGTQICIAEFMAPYFVFLPEGRSYQEGELQALTLIAPCYDNDYISSLNMLKSEVSQFNKYRDGISAARVINGSLLLLTQNLNEESLIPQLFLLINDLSDKDITKMSKTQFWNYKGKIDVLCKLLEGIQDENIKVYYAENIGNWLKVLAFETIAKEQMKTIQLGLDENFTVLKSLLDDYSEQIKAENPELFKDEHAE